MVLVFGLFTDAVLLFAVVSFYVAIVVFFLRHSILLLSIKFLLFLKMLSFLIFFFSVHRICSVSTLFGPPVCRNRLSWLFLFVFVFFSTYI